MYVSECGIVRVPCICLHSLKRSGPDNDRHTYIVLLYREVQRECKTSHNSGRKIFSKICTLKTFGV